MSLAGVGWPKHRRDTAAAGAGIAAGSRGKGNRHRLMRRLLTLQSRDAIRHTFASNELPWALRTGMDETGGSLIPQRFQIEFLGRRLEATRRDMARRLRSRDTQAGLLG